MTQGIEEDDQNLPENCLNLTYLARDTPKVQPIYLYCIELLNELLRELHELLNLEQTRVRK